MELAGEAFLLNLSLVAIGFASVSVLVMLIRQMLGGELTAFDLHLILGYITCAFAVALGALLPPMLVYTGAGPAVVWGVSGVLGALLVGAHLYALVWRRVRVMRVKLPLIFLIDMSLQAIGALVLLVNALPQFQTTGVYAIGLTLVMATIMYAFVRRIASLVGNGDPPARFDPHQG